MTPGAQVLSRLSVAAFLGSLLSHKPSLENVASRVVSLSGASTRREIARLESKEGGNYVPPLFLLGSRD